MHRAVLHVPSFNYKTLNVNVSYRDFQSLLIMYKGEGLKASHIGPPSRPHLLPSLPHDLGPAQEKINAEHASGKDKYLSVRHQDSRILNNSLILCAVTQVL